MSLPVLAPPTPGGPTFTWLYEYSEDGTLLGYRLSEPTFDPQTNTLHTQIAASTLVRGVVYVPALVSPWWVQNHDPQVHIYSAPGKGVDFGVAAPQFTTFRVLGPQVGGRLFVFNPATKNYGWIAAAGVGPVSGP